MKITKANGTWEQILVKLNKISDSTTNLSPKVGYSIVKNKMAIDMALQPYVEIKNKIVQKYADGSGEVNRKTNPEGYMKTIMDINEVAVEKTSIDIRMINLGMLGDNDLPLEIITALEFMLED